MAWILSPLGIGIIIVLVLLITSLICWKLKPIKEWLAGRKVSVKIKAGPLEIGLDEKPKPEKPTRPPAGVSFGEGNVFNRSKIRAAGRDLRSGGAASESSSGKSPGVDWGKKGRFDEAEIDVAGRDILDARED